MRLPLMDRCMGTVSLRDIGEQVLSRTTKGLESGEAKRDEIKGPTWDEMLVLLTLLNDRRCRHIWRVNMLHLHKRSMSTTPPELLILRM